MTQTKFEGAARDTRAEMPPNVDDKKRLLWGVSGRLPLLAEPQLGSVPEAFRIPAGHVRWEKTREESFIGATSTHGMQ